MNRRNKIFIVVVLLALIVILNIAFLLGSSLTGFAIFGGKSAGSEKIGGKLITLPSDSELNNVEEEETSFNVPSTSVSSSHSSGGSSGGGSSGGGGGSSGGGGGEETQPTDPGQPPF